MVAEIVHVQKMTGSVREYKGQPGLRGIQRLDPEEIGIINILGLRDAETTLIFPLSLNSNR